jgi:Membrane-associated sensor, integral membrane domain/His Kinase A (phospho-acceptor) domain
MARDVSEEIATCLITLPPTPLQRWLAFCMSAILLVGVGILAPFADMPLPRINVFIPSFEAIIFVTDFITSVLLFSQFSIYRSRALLALASGYLFTALIIIPHVLTYPGVFSPTGLLGAGLSTTSWLYWFWHIGFPVALFAYAWFKDEKAAATQTSTLFAVGWSAVLVCALVCGLTWLTTLGESLLPQLFADVIYLTPFNHYLLVFGMLICVSALALLWARRHSVLDLWLMVVAVAAISELGLVALTSARFTLGFYAGRLFSPVTSTTVLVVLLAETSRLYARLVNSNLMLQRERQNKLMNLEAMAASISHEARQPLGALASNASAAVRFLKRTPPDLAEAQSALNRIVSDSRRTSEIFDNLRALFGRREQKVDPVDVNKVGPEHTFKKSLQMCERLYAPAKTNEFWRPRSARQCAIASDCSAINPASVNSVSQVVAYRLAACAEVARDYWRFVRLALEESQVSRCQHQRCSHFWQGRFCDCR